MNGLKKIGLRIFFVFELMVFCFIYFFGPHGLKALQELEAENQILLNNISFIKKEIDNLDVEIMEWHKNPFYKEKIAREHLQMARSDEEIYYLQSAFN